MAPKSFKKVQEWFAKARGEDNSNKFKRKSDGGSKIGAVNTNSSDPSSPSPGM